MVACSGYFHCQLWLYVHIDESMPNLKLFHTLRIIVFFLDNPKYINCFTKTSIAASDLSFPKTFDSGKTWNNANRSAWLAWSTSNLYLIWTWQASKDWGCHRCSALWDISSFICRVPYFHAYPLQKRWRILSVFTLFVNTPMTWKMYKGIRNNGEFKGLQVSIN
jgi:hypothetical protein